MRARSGVLVAAVLYLAAAGATPAVAGSVKGSGHRSVEIHDFDGLRGVSNATPGDVKLQLGESDRLEVEMDDNLHEYLQLEVDDGILKIRFERGVQVKPRRPIRMALTLSELDYVEISGSGDLAADELTCDGLRVRIPGSGDMDISRLRTGDLEVGISGSGDVRLDRLGAENVRLEISGSGDFDSPGVEARVFATELDGSGNVQAAGEVVEQDLRLAGSGDYRTAGMISKRARVDITGSGDAQVHAVDELVARLSGSGDLSYRGEPSVTQHVTGSGRARRL